MRCKLNIYYISRSKITIDFISIEKFVDVLEIKLKFPKVISTFLILKKLFILPFISEESAIQSLLYRKLMRFCPQQLRVGGGGLGEWEKMVGGKKCR
jgi:hypothetical protein